MLACVSCDLPATRKVCGFQNFNANFGCSKYLKEFPTESFGKKPDYGGYDYENWTLRDTETHKSNALKCKEAVTATLRTKIEKSYGAKYSELINLHFFDVTKYYIIFLGLAKHNGKIMKFLVHLII